MKVGILSHGFTGWGGGIDFIRYVALAMANAESKSIESRTLFLPGDDALSYFRRILFPLRSALKSAMNGEIPVFQKYPGFLERYFRENFADFSDNFDLRYCGSSYQSQLDLACKYKMEVVLPCMVPPPPGFAVPWVGYLYDFQHRHLTYLFDDFEISKRNDEFALMLGSARHIIVNSQSVANDANNFFPAHTAKVHVLPFSPCPQQSWLESNLDVRSKFGLVKPYYLVSNQFWKHKDHATVFRAYARYILAGGDALLVCTGGTKDYRFPEYYGELIELLNELRISDKVRILGHIPKIEQIALMKKARSVIQPTLFEGGPGGGASYDAISLGVPVIASDIPVNLEMNCGDVTFFRARDDQHLFEALVDRDQNRVSEMDVESLWLAGIRRRRHCGNVLVDIAEQAMDEN